jgi:hypothetical protein
MMHNENRRHTRDSLSRHPERRRAENSELAAVASTGGFTLIELLMDPNIVLTTDAADFSTLIKFSPAAYRKIILTTKPGRSQ